MLHVKLRDIHHELPKPFVGILVFFIYLTTELVTMLRPCLKTDMVEHT